MLAVHMWSAVWIYEMFPRIKSIDCLHVENSALHWQYWSSRTYICIDMWRKCKSSPDGHPQKIPLVKKNNGSAFPEAYHAKPINCLMDLHTREQCNPPANQFVHTGFVPCETNEDLIKTNPHSQITWSNFTVLLVMRCNMRFVFGCAS